MLFNTITVQRWWYFDIFELWVEIMGNFILVTGGARSGKSSYALERTERISDRRCFVATCPVIDPEMDDRILAHKKEREGRGWDSIEEETDLVQVINSLIGDNSVVLIDCLTLWVNNLMYLADNAGKTFGEAEMRCAAGELVAAINAFTGSVCCVTNEVGLGIVPDNPLARKYRDLVGSCNRILADKADEVILVSCGIPLSLKTLRDRT
jgi:adenosylcobinamide kinase/adenosylcobinamide-phosphate guanylyltransferase